MMDYDVMTLRALSNEEVEDFRWGAGASVCLEYLMGIGLVTRSYHVSQKGYKFLEWSKERNWSSDIETFREEVKNV